MAEWRPVLGYEGLYAISDAGEVRGLTRGKLLASHPSNQGYLRVILYRGGVAKNASVHRLVAEAFMRPIGSDEVVRHRNGNRRDNRRENLVIGSQSENIDDSVLHGTHHNAAKSSCPQGHSYSPENTYRPKRGGRMCRTCRSPVLRLG